MIVLRDAALRDGDVSIDEPGRHLFVACHFRRMRFVLTGAPTSPIFISCRFSECVFSTDTIEKSSAPPGEWMLDCALDG